MPNIHAYRFRSRAAVSAGSTLYLTAKDARKLAHQLYKIARSIEKEPFHQSACGSFSVEAAAETWGWAEDKRKES